MKNKIIYIILIIIIIIITTGCNYKNNNIMNKTKEVTNNLKIKIEDKEYIINLEENETVNEFIKLLPIELNMNELNNNEKYAYLTNTLKTNSYNPKHINSGDVMLYGNNCLVIFYKSFDTTYSYTKIGHIDNLPDLGDKNINVRIEK